VAKKVPQTEAQVKQWILGALRTLKKRAVIVALLFFLPTIQYAS
jgi:hypothetical protein